MEFLPIGQADLQQRGWNELDIIFISGDAYVDHPSFAAALLGRFLESRGFKVGIIAQPDWRNLRDFKKLGRPRLFFAVSAGNVDSMVNHYTADKKKRLEDIYSPGGKAGHRPDRATLVYCNRLREAYPGANIVIGGIEASLRRLAHYDYWSNQVRRSVLMDSKADLLVYGMGENVLLEIARKIKAGKLMKHITGLRGTCYITNQLPAEALEIPSYEEVASSKEAFARANQIIHGQINPYHARVLAQKHGDRWVIQNVPLLPLTIEQMDEIYSLAFNRQYHPRYEKAGGVPALQPVQFSLLTHRGCFGGCSFCSIGLHQGKFIQSRSMESILQEAESFVSHPDFRGSIPDVGAASANMYGLKGKNEDLCRQCSRESCLHPQVCKNLHTEQDLSVKLWEKLRKVRGIKNIRVASGVRYDLILADSSRRYLEDLCRYHVGGQLKVAPEHVSSPVTDLMGKPSGLEYVKFMRAFQDTNKKLGKEQYLIPYFISGHPGAGLKETIELAEFVRDNLQYYPEQVQNFTPTPMTHSTSMWYTGLNQRGAKVYIPFRSEERKQQRALLQHRNRKNHELARAALQKAGRGDLIGFSSLALVPQAKGRLSKNEAIRQNNSDRKKSGKRRSPRK